jgi:hypothetical protein
MERLRLERQREDVERLEKDLRNKMQLIDQRRTEPAGELRCDANTPVCEPRLTNFSYSAPNHSSSKHLPDPQAPPYHQFRTSLSTPPSLSYRWVTTPTSLALEALGR